MPEITREEAKQAIAEWIEQHVFARDAFTGHEKFHDRYEAILRLALAALEDAERVEWMGEDPAARTSITMDRWYEGGHFRAAIDRARGAVIGGR